MVIYFGSNRKIRYHPYIFFLSLDPPEKGDTGDRRMEIKKKKKMLAFLLRKVI